MSNEPAAEPSGSNIPLPPLCEGRFVAYRQLGAGSQAQTFEGVDRKSGTPVAIKRFDVHGASSWKDVELAEREARVLSTLTHPALPAYVHHFEEDGALYLVMQKVEGNDLAKRIAAGQRFTFDELLSLIETLGDVFAYLHQQAPPIVHRDIKPSNIIERASGGYALIDFGSVRDGLRPTGGSTVVGTFGFMAPEQFQGRALPATDLYGTGATILTLLTGTTPDKLPHRGLELDVRRTLPATTPPEWIDLLERLLAADPDKRSFDLRSVVPVLRAAASARARASSPRMGARSPFADPNRGFGATAPGPTSGDPTSAHSGRFAGERFPAGPVRAESEWWVGAGTTFPFVILVVLSILRVLLFLVMQVALPVLLNMLSVVFGKGLRLTATEVSNAGHEVNRQLTGVINRVAQSRPFVVRRRSHSRPMDDGYGHPRSHSQPTDDGYGRPRVPFDSGQPPQAEPAKRRVRVGNFEVDLPVDDRAPTEDSRSHRRKR